jgi:prevent-host-death family protein
MKTLTSADAKNKFGELIDLARAAPIVITKHERPVVIVLAVEEYEKLIERLDGDGARSTQARQRQPRNSKVAPKKSTR